MHKRRFETRIKRASIRAQQERAREARTERAERDLKKAEPEKPKLNAAQRAIDAAVAEGASAAPAG